MAILDKIEAAEISRGGSFKWRDIPIGAALGTCNVFTVDKRGASCCFYWSVCVDGELETGRDLDDFRDLCFALSETAGCHLVMMVQDTTEFFQFVRKYFDCHRLFAAQERKPLDAELVPGLHLKSGAEISGMTLQENARRLGGFKVKTPSTEFPPLAPTSALDLDTKIKIDEEARTMCELCREHMHRADGIGKIPLTKTGYPRRYLRDRILYGRGKGTTKIDAYRAADYRKFIAGAIMTPEEYKVLRAVVGGGICTMHPDVLHKVVPDPMYFDRKSAYPAHMVYDYVPNGNAERLDHPTLDKVVELMKKRCVAAVFVFKNLRLRYPGPAYIRSTYADTLCDPVDMEQQNGYVKSAAEITLALTELDFECVRECYRWDGVECLEAMVYGRGKLPNLIRKYVLARFKGKEAARTPEEKRVQKELLNSISGIMIMDPVRTVYAYDIQSASWCDPEDPDIEQAVEAYNTSPSRFTRFPWGIWIVAHCRRAEWRAWYALADLFVYGDTDSVYFKIPSAPDPFGYFWRENERMQKQAELAAKELGVSMQFFKPFGKLLGTWCMDKAISRMCILGQKNYIQEHKDSSICVIMAGVNPELSSEYIRRRYARNGQDCIEAFSTTTFYPGRYRDTRTGDILSATGRKLTVHQDDMVEGDFIDASGQRQHFCTLSGSIKMFIPITRRDLEAYEQKKRDAGLADVLPRAAILSKADGAAKLDHVENR